MPVNAEECKQYDETLIACQALGGRLPTEKEFRLSYANGWIEYVPEDSYAINVSNGGVNNCAQIADDVLNFIPAGDRVLYYYLVFDI